MARWILVVDDDDDLRQLLGTVLRHEGFEVREAASGYEALARMRESAPVMVLLDIMMPELDGFDVCRRLKADQRLASVPVVFVTALDDSAQRKLAFTLGAEDYINKPIGPRDLMVRLRGVMARHGLVA